MPTNDNGHDITVGPDANGVFTTVAAGEDYELPTPPAFVDPDASTEAPEAVEEDADPDPVPYDAMKVPELRALLSARGLDPDGNKPELVERLTAHDAAGDLSAESTPDPSNTNPDSPEGDPS